MAVTKRLTPNDAVFLLGESRETMFHVAALLPFSPAADTAPDQMRQLMNQVRASTEIYPPWNLKLRTPEVLWNPLQTWVEDHKLDIDYHVRRTALPTPGDERELGIVVSRLHSHPVDFHRPPWEAHLIEGLEGGRFAFYVKVHHSLIDGYSAVRVLARSMSRDPDERGRPLFFSLPPPTRPEPAATTDSEAVPLGFPDLFAAVKTQLGAARTVAGTLRSVYQQVMAGERDLMTPMRAPKCILNGRISRSRRFATQKLELDRIKAVAQASGGTVNDVVMALSGGSLRRYLRELDALPGSPLVAMVPVNIRPKDDPGGGNAVGAILASLGTHLSDPGARLQAVISSTKKAKEQLQGLSKSAIVQYSALLLTPFLLQTLPGAATWVPPTFNVVISNVPGPDETLYFNGARLEACYPMSIPVHGLALNITCSGYAGYLNFGFIGCRDTLPHLQRLAVYCKEELSELEKAGLRT